MRRHLLILLSCFALASTLPAQPAPSAKDTIAYTTALVRLRDKPLANARSLAAVGQGTRVRLHKCSAGWCRVGVSQLVGYVPQSSLTARAPGGFLSKRGFVDSRGSSVRSPSRVLTKQPPQGATARCRDGTYSFSQSRRGTCSHHGGVANWL